MAEQALLGQPGRARSGRWRRAGLGCAAWLTLLVAGSGADEAAVRGQALERERVALPPAAVSETLLAEDAPAEVFGSARVAPGGSASGRFAQPAATPG